ncbi:protein-export chaperone SecB [Melissococcus sp. OM08-11BH]|uniref:protein-export chaperone SecB n=1 Tax=Melissococcus sp. OM08-11BH TaxID=2293110 RepID=UPI000E4A5EC2|nr:protein-export chaperone SecB [Melissococcus sp. OM08-11BH]RGI31875.1 hypothetical protein DXC12_00810 [Melissococcus sp. OM08-11BH]
MKPIIEFEGYTVQHLLVNSIDFDDELIELSDNEPLSIKVKHGISDDKLTAGLIVNVILFSKEIDKKIDISVEGVFTINEEFSKEDTKSIERALRVNGTAILYPYIRSMVSMVSSFDSSSAVVLPALNTKIFNN